MTLKEFVDTNREEIDEYILRFEPEVELTDEERKARVRSDYGLQLWARNEEVDV